jgi:hypothetical protein
MKFAKGADVLNCILPLDFGFTSYQRTKTRSGTRAENQKAAW